MSDAAGSMIACSRSARLILAGGLSALLVTGCGTREPERPAPRPATPPKTLPTPAPAPARAADYVATAASIDLFEIRSAELALARARDPRLQNFARTMISAHRGTSAQLSFAGRRLNLLPSATLLPQHRSMLDRLAASPDFDSLYWRQQVTVHEMALDLHAGYATMGDSPTLRPVAAAALPIVRRHLDQLRSIR